jgi:uncharacterized protein
MIPERPVTLTVGDGVSLEARLAAPAVPTGGVVICHPHPLYGGDMDNPVVVRVQEVCSGLDLATLRFNFRGVGASTGAHGEGVAEQEDARAALDALEKAIGAGPLAIVGYSFGARIAAAVAQRDTRPAALGLIAPPLTMYDFASAVGSRVPTLVVAGTADPYCPPDGVARLTASVPTLNAVAIEGADHFFFGKLFPLSQAIDTWARQLLRPRQHS